VGLPAKAVLEAKWASGGTKSYPVQFNPTELQFEKAAQIAEISIPGLDAPLQQFVRGQAEKLSLELLFDTTENGMGLNARSVTEETDRIFQLIRVDPERHAPPVVTFRWKRIAGDALGPETADQKRDSFTGLVESVRQKFTLFSPEGIPLRATVAITLREFRPLDQQLKELKLASPDRTHSHVLRAGETLSQVAATEWGRPEEWRAIAEDNDIEDPRRLTPGAFLRIPVLGR
jgi:hypothetical protein